MTTRTTSAQLPSAPRQRAEQGEPHLLPTALRIERVDFTDARHRTALLALLEEYACTPEGGATPLDPIAKARLCDLLASRAHYAGWLAFDDTAPVGLINCFEGVSTFRARPLLNIHDIVVSEHWRRRGIGRALLAAAEAHAREQDCCKLTLEVLEGNAGAAATYRASGFRPYELDPAMGRALFFEKKLD
jgi:ribosomal protein S18 acetylase RimI-like enzyme